MKKSAQRITIFALILGATAAMAMAKTIKKEVTFESAIVINGTTIKAGTYEVAFDDQAGTLSIMKGKKVLASAKAKLEESAQKSESSYVTITEADAQQLKSVALKSNTQAVILGSDKSDSAQ